MFDFLLGHVMVRVCHNGNSAGLIVQVLFFARGAFCGSIWANDERVHGFTGGCGFGIPYWSLE